MFHNVERFLPSKSIQNFPTEPETKVAVTETRFLVTDLRTIEVIYDDKINMSNYAVPFDFD